METGFGNLEFAMHGCGRDLERSGGLIVSETAEAKQLDDLALAGILLGQALKSKIELDDTGLATNTIVVYSSDQGFFLGEHGWFDKRWIFQESARSPLLIRWPGVALPGRTNQQLVSHLDLAEIDRCGVVGMDRDPGVDRLRVGRPGHIAARCYGGRCARQTEANNEGAAALEQVAARE